MDGDVVIYQVVVAPNLRQDMLPLLLTRFHFPRLVLLFLMALELVETLLKELVLVEIDFVHHLSFLNQGPALPGGRKWALVLL